MSVPKPYIDSNNVSNSSCPKPTCLGQFTGIGDICPSGTYCPRGSNVPKDCLPGSYNNQTGQETCNLCPPGYYCLTGAVTYLDTVCPSGHYCLVNTTQPYEYPCPPGTFNKLTGQQTADACVACPGGSYCEGYGNSWPTGLCSPGWYCNGSAAANKTSIHGGECQPGYYCPAGSSHPKPCDGGKFCNVAGLDDPAGKCTAGYYCKLKAKLSTPTDVITGNICPVGFYCPEGSTDPVPCDPGYYQDSTQATNSSACKLCTRGKYCKGTGLAGPVGPCAPGYYCPPGQSSKTPVAYPCPAGYICKEGVDQPEKCPSGSYQNLPLQDTCKECPKRFYCNAAYGGVDNFNLYVCPEGYYCPNGTEFAEQHPCDYGTFSNTTGLADQGECSPCLGGFYCGERGLTEPKTPCSSGYYCKRGTCRYRIKSFCLA